MQPMHRLHHGGHLVLVSILIRPEGRMQLAPARCAEQRPVHVLSPFSILIRPEGRMQLAGHCGMTARFGCFNPHPARRPDATGAGIALPVTVQVFQSSSGQKAGCNNCPCTSLDRHPGKFQSSSGQKAGCNPRRSPCYTRR